MCSPRCLSGVFDNGHDHTRDQRVDRIGGVRDVTRSGGRDTSTRVPRRVRNLFPGLVLGAVACPGAQRIRADRASARAARAVPEQVDSLALPIGDDGVVIGVDAEGQPAVLGLNRPTPYDVVLIGGLWTAQVLALRAAATGARVAVETGRAPAWMQMVHAMGAGRTA